MKIESVYINRFGALSDYRLDFSDGINIIEGDNESGKSTICGFIKFMLYGVSGKEEKRLIFGWDGEKISGSMTVKCGEQRYRIERAMTEGGRGGCKIVDLNDNSVVFEGKNPGEVFLGVSAEVFSNTAFVGQRGENKIDGGDLSDGIENILFSADENINTQKALKRLDDARVALLHKNKHGGKIYELQGEIEDLEVRLKRAVESNQSIIIKEGTIRDIENKTAENAAKLADLEKRIEYYETGTLKRQYDRIIKCSKELEIEQKKLEIYADKYHWNGFLPGEEYFSEISGIEEEIRFAERNMKLLEEEIASIQTKISDESSSPKRIFVSEKEEIISGMIHNVQKFKTLMYIGTVFCVFALVLGIGIGWFMRSAAHMFMIGCGVGAAMLIAAVICFASAVKSRKKNLELFAIYGAENEEDLKNILDFMIEENNLYNKNEELCSELTRKYENQENQRKNNLQRLSEILNKWNMTDADEARQVYSEYKTEEEDIRSRIKSLESIYNSTLETFKGRDINDLKQRFSNYIETIPLEEINYDALKREYDFVQNAQKALADKKHEDEKLLAAFYAQAEQPNRIYDEIAEKKAEVSKLEKRHNAYLLAHEKLTAAGANMKENISPRLSEYAGGMLDRLSENKYSTLGVGKDFELSYTTKNDSGVELQTHNVDFMSAGTQDIAYISLRFALVNLLYRKEKPTVVFDDSFTRLDDTRLENMLRLTAGLSEEDMQIIIFSCHKREAEHMKNIAEFKFGRLGE